MRADFERWHFGGAASHAADRNADGGYKYMPAAQAWNAWQAGAKNEREACIRAVEAEALECQTGSAGDEAYDNAIRHAAAAIRARSNAKVSGGGTPSAGLPGYTAGGNGERK